IKWGKVQLMPFAEIVRLASSSSEMTGQSVSIVAIVLTELVTVPIYALIAIPAMLGAYVGSYSKRRVLKSKKKLINKETLLPWSLGLVLGLLVSGIPTLLVADYGFNNLLPYWSIGLFIASLKMGVTFPVRVWRWGMAVGLGLPIAVILRVIVDVSRDSSSHNLFPFEILIALCIAAVCSFLGAYLGTMVGQIIDKLKTGGNS
ncbi:MAG: hypothetical protein WBD30_13850, partial [Bacteroidota bacterium]